MSLNKQTGNMYPWVSHTWNPIGGRCPHNCSYCYMRRWWKKLGSLKLRKHFLNDNLGNSRTIFVGSSCDMFAEGVPHDWIDEVLRYCSGFDNTYLFQTKNPCRFTDFNTSFPEKTTLGTTAETNRDGRWSEAPPPLTRLRCIADLPYPVMVSVEPIMDFDLKPFVWGIREAEPTFVSIGANSQGYNLPEPNGDKIQALIDELKKFTEVREKWNLKRLMT